MKKPRIKIIWLYPKLMSIYGDFGNVLILKKRLEWRGVEADIVPIGLGEKIPSDTDLLFMGGGQDRQQTMCVDDLVATKKDSLCALIEENTPALFVCGAYQLLGEFYHPLTEDEKKTFDPMIFGKNYHIKDTKEYVSKKGAQLTGAGVLKVYTVHFGENKPRLIGNAAAEIHPLLLVELKKVYNEVTPDTIVGFENHGGRTFPTEGWSNSLYPLGTIIKGAGNNGDDKTEGVLYKNVIGTYFHGPLLAKNPHIADFLLSRTEKLKDRWFTLSHLDDIPELTAHESALR